MEKITQKSAASSVQTEVLYVEDDNLNWLVADLHMRENCHVVQAKNARMAVELLRQHKFDLILMDIELANSTLDGIQLTEAIRGRIQTDDVPADIREAYREVPIIFVTAYEAMYTRKQLIARGGSAMVTKPVNFEHLLKVVSKFTRCPEKLEYE